MNKREVPDFLIEEDENEKQRSFTYEELETNIWASLLMKPGFISIDKGEEKEQAAEMSLPEWSDG
jgi:hypothetical protein